MAMDEYLILMKDIGTHHINLLAGQEVRYEEDQGLAHSYYEFPESNFGLKDVSLAGRTERGTSTASRYGLLSGFFRAIYNYNDRFLFTEPYVPMGFLPLTKAINGAPFLRLPQPGISTKKSL